MKTIKIIDLLNKIANGEEAPKKIKYNDKIWNYKDGIMEYISEDTYFGLSNFEFDELNEKVEILEEEKKIPEKIDLTGYWDKNSLRTEEWCSSEELIGVKINEILDYLESKEKGE